VRKVLLTVAALLLLCSDGWAQGIRYYPPSSGGGAVTYIVKAAPGIATGTTNEEILYSIVLPANTFASVGDSVIITAHSSTAANTNVKAMYIKTALPGTSFGGVATTTSAAYMTLQVMVMRTSDTEAIMLNPDVYGGVNITAGQQTALTGLDFTAAITWVVTGSSTVSAGEVTLKTLTVFSSK
jgi:hypothetical protein